MSNIKNGVNDALTLLQRWNAQQTGFIELRPLKLNIMSKIVERVGGENPVILDLACGPGSLSHAILQTNPNAKIVAVDKDPVLLSIARDVFADDRRVKVIEADLDLPDWKNAVLEASGQPFDVVVSATALHWLQPDVLTRVYFELADMVRPDGIVMNSDHLFYDECSQPRLRALSDQLEREHEDTSFSKGDIDDWDQWWEAAQSNPNYEEAVRRREEIWHGKLDPTPKVTPNFHLSTLRSAGFREVGIIWQYFNDLIVCGYR
ncbi:putative SAM-dependent methyltransferase [Vibrio nigripulchritudo SFn27]|uniref:Putative SAM-dependent methyltransferase n=1 Tax=Vibrio nigripulchritudo TaxID=28173 RepID=U4K489_9VIBR|nr:class I SAM-dependent methyltransferase [Vibrio nigripulchritudo]CCN85842.1 putative SAM-dependent methyltransferase [Vibrio nigripulchritudo BLFn1]CCN90507.1 putative SAM-dependent methyltransferase [Vibrio nigripulchritudo SFn27]CCN93626.1 putative SAM-dependent methyltransferase [Vibrio nigripulchritudo ENn2]CCO42948.1 putative SAM-dependent methyltransferase [Vibrio nigripulchritudo SFn135]CCO50741.1 putative SAM-dependent methyltransferase [Vibrio nigripulchritudo Wn13]